MAGRIYQFFSIPPWTVSHCDLALAATIVHKILLEFTMPTITNIEDLRVLAQ